MKYFGTIVIEFEDDNLERAATRASEMGEYACEGLAGAYGDATPRVVTATSTREATPVAEIGIFKAEVASLQALLSMRESLGDFTDREAFTVWNGRLSKAWLATMAALGKIVPGADDALFAAASARNEAES